MKNFIIKENFKYILPKEQNLLLTSKKYNNDTLFHKKILIDINKNSSLKNYDIEKEITKGGSSQIFIAINKKNNEKVIIKKLKSNNEKRFIREVNMLIICKDIKNVIEVLDYFYDEQYYIVFPYFKFNKSRHIFDKFDKEQIKIFIKNLLTTINNIHNKGIIHRDIKPGNILIKNENIFYIIDFGISDFYIPYRKFNYNLGTRNFKSPEQLIKIKSFDYKIDVWAIGIIFAELIFKKFPFFSPNNEKNTLENFMNIFGINDIKKFLKYFNSNNIFNLNFNNKIKYNIFSKNNTNEVNLLYNLLILNPNNRLSIHDALNHNYFN